MRVYACLQHTLAGDQRVGKHTTLHHDQSTKIFWNAQRCLGRLESGGCYTYTANVNAAAFWQLQLVRLARSLGPDHLVHQLVCPLGVEDAEACLYHRRCGHRVHPGAAFDRDPVVLDGHVPDEVREEDDPDDEPRGEEERLNECGRHDPSRDQQPRVDLQPRMAGIRTQPAWRRQELPGACMHVRGVSTCATNVSGESCSAPHRQLGQQAARDRAPRRARSARRPQHACRHRRRKQRQRTYSGSLGFAAGLCRRAERGGALKATKA